MSESNASVRNTIVRGRETKPVRAACRQAAGRSGMAPVLVTRGRYPQRSVQEFDRFYGF